jgi:hypothetical protein
VGRDSADDEQNYVCPDHVNDGILDVCYDYDLIGKRLRRLELRLSIHDSI